MLVRYLVVFLALALTVVGLEPWIEASDCTCCSQGWGLPALMWFFHGCAIWYCGDGRPRVSNFLRSWARARIEIRLALLSRELVNVAEVLAAISPLPALLCEFAASYPREACKRPLG